MYNLAANCVNWCKGLRYLTTADQRRWRRNYNRELFEHDRRRPSSVLRTKSLFMPDGSTGTACDYVFRVPLKLFSKASRPKGDRGEREGGREERMSYANIKRWIVNQIQWRDFLRTAPCLSSFDSFPIRLTASKTHNCRRGQLEHRGWGWCSG